MNLILTTLAGLFLLVPPSKTGSCKSSLAMETAAGKSTLTPVHWIFRAEPTKEKGTYLLHCTAMIDDSWHIYAQVQPESAISEPTKIIFVKSPLIAFDGNVIEKGTPEKQILEEAGIEQNIYKKSVDFVQKVTLKTKGDAKTTIKGTVTYQACTDEMCLPPGTEPFTIPLSTN